MSRATVSLDDREIRHLIGAHAQGLAQAAGGMTVADIALAIRRLAQFHKALQTAAAQPQGAANVATPQPEARN